MITTDTFLCQLSSTQEAEVLRELRHRLKKQGYSQIEIIKMVESAKENRLVALEEYMDIHKYIDEYNKEQDNTDEFLEEYKRIPESVKKQGKDAILDALMLKSKTETTRLKVQILFNSGIEKYYSINLNGECREAAMTQFTKKLTKYISDGERMFYFRDNQGTPIAMINPQEVTAFEFV